jgi:putative membrane protein
VMMRSSEYGAVVVGGKGRYYLADDRVEGENPLEGFGPNAAQHLRRTDSFADAPDMLVNSFYNVDTNEVAAFEELIGSHGGMGGYQTQPLLLYPAEWELDGDELIGAAAVYRQLKSWLAQYDQGNEPDNGQA